MQFTSTTCQSTGLALGVGTFVTVGVVHYLANNKIKKTDIDELTQYEHVTNLVNGPCIFLMLLRLWIPKSCEEALSNTAVALIVEFNGNFGIVHRAIAGCGIALMRYVIRGSPLIVTPLGTTKTVNISEVSRQFYYKVL